jgi:hypothetical protein
LSLVLRSMQDGGKQAGGSVTSAQNRDFGVTIVRAGVASQSRGK